MVASDSPRGIFEGRLAALQGRRLTAVGYWDLHHPGPEPPTWDYGDWHHAVMGVELGTDQGPVTVTWTDTFYPYGVEVLHEPMEGDFAVPEFGPERVGPDGPGLWTPLLGSAIESTACHWERLTIGPGRRADGSITGPAYHVDVPVAVRLDVASCAVWFVAGIPEPAEPLRVFIPGDEIMVVFSGTTMRGIGFTDPAFLRGSPAGGGSDAEG